MNFLAWVERAGNRLPDPATLFLIGTAVIMALSQLAVSLDWSVHSTPGVELKAKSLLSSDGLWWFMSHMVENFIRFPPLAIVLVGMLGIGLAERSGLLPTLLRAIILHIPAPLLTPATVFAGILSSIALDAGYVVLPPIAAALYQAAGRSPLAGIAAVFAGVSAGFSANLFITAVDPLLAGLTQAAAAIISPGYSVAVTANWWFMLVSTLLLTLTGWAVSDGYVAPRLGRAGLEAAIEPDGTAGITSAEARGLRLALVAAVLALFLVVLAGSVPGAPLYGQGVRFARWIEVTVPLLCLLFFVPGLVYGVCVGTIRNDRDVARMLGDTFARLGPYIVLAFFAAQFIESFKYSGLGEMLAIAGGAALVSAQIASPWLLSSFIVLVAIANLFIGSASAKYAFLAPVFVPMFMQVGFSPELTQAAYRVGDSVSNVITPFNPYMIIILAQVQKYLKGSGLGTLVAMMLPYTIVFAVVWSGLLLFWVAVGWPLGPGGRLYFH